LPVLGDADGHPATQAGLGALHEVDDRLKTNYHAPNADGYGRT
jgi:hypothetical protein